jgi:muramidase (phage lysozyme)
LLLLSPIWLFPQPVKANFTFEHVAIIKTDDSQSKDIPDKPPKKTVAEIKKPTVKPSHKKVLTQTGRTDTGRDSVKSYSKEEVIKLINDYSQLYGISPQTPLAIAKCESGYRYDAKNKSSTASGVYQWLSSSWKGQPDGKAGVSVFNAEANVKAAVWLIAHGKTSAWNSSKSCWN